MWSFRSVRALGLAFLVGAMLAGCGSEAGSQQSVASAPPQPNYSGLSVYSLVEDGFSIGVPSGWTAMTSEDAYSESVNAIVEASPKLAEYRDILTSSDTMKLIALEYDPEACICSTIDVIAFPFPKGWTVKGFEARGIAYARKIALPGTKPNRAAVKIPAGSGIRLTTRTRLSGTRVRIIATQYLIHTRTNAYILSYAASPDVTKTYKQLFARSAQSLREV
jgi:hypothetical protein